MRMQVRKIIYIVPDTGDDVEYLEENLGLKKAGDRCICERVDVMNKNQLAYIKIIEK